MPYPLLPLQPTSGPVALYLLHSLVFSHILGAEEPIFAECGRLETRGVMSNKFLGSSTTNEHNVASLTSQIIVWSPKI